MQVRRASPRAPDGLFGVRNVEPELSDKAKAGCLLRDDGMHVSTEFDDGLSSKLPKSRNKFDPHRYA
jgi:hypothetical protein